MISESRIDQIIKEAIDETVVSQFTPYTKDERDRNFKALRESLGVLWKIGIRHMQRL